MAEKYYFYTLWKKSTFLSYLLRSTILHSKWTLLKSCFNWYRVFIGIFRKREEIFKRRAALVQHPILRVIRGFQHFYVGLACHVLVVYLQHTLPQKSLSSPKFLSSTFHQKIAYCASAEKETYLHKLFYSEKTEPVI